MRQKCPNSEFFWSVFPPIRTGYKIWSFFIVFNNIWIGQQLKYFIRNLSDFFGKQAI